MRQWTQTLTQRTNGKGLYEITPQIKEWVASLPVSEGLLTLYIRHTSASLLIQENDDAEVTLDLNDFFTRLAPEDNRLYRHTYEGPDDMPAHIRAALTQTHLSIPIMEGKLTLGVWQGIYVFEHRAAPHERHLVLYAVGEERPGLVKGDTAP